MPITWREMIDLVQGKAAEVGDHVLDLPVSISLANDNQFATGLFYQEHQPATNDDAEEIEQLILETNWD